jgi:CheY-like chemotaxis protein
MDGFEVLDRIRELDARSGRVTPAVAISAHATEDSFARSRRAGFAVHVAKPYRIQLLMRAIRDALEISRADAADLSRQEAPGPIAETTPRE